MDQEALARLQSGEVEHHCQTVKKVSGSAASSPHREARVHRQRRALLGEAIFRIAAAGYQRADLVTERPAGDALTGRHHLAGNLQARNIRRAGRRRVKPCAASRPAG